MRASMQVCVHVCCLCVVGYTYMRARLLMHAPMRGCVHSHQRVCVFMPVHKCVLVHLRVSEGLSMDSCLRVQSASARVYVRLRMCASAYVNECASVCMCLDGRLSILRN